MSERCVVDEDGVRWDRVSTCRLDHGPNTRQTIAVAGLVDGEDGVLVLRLPGMIVADFILGAREARALRDALVARVSPLPDGLIHAKQPIGAQIAGGFCETFFADGTSEAHPLEEDEEDEDEDEDTHEATDRLIPQPGAVGVEGGGGG